MGREYCSDRVAEPFIVVHLLDSRDDVPHVDVVLARIIIVEVVSKELSTRIDVVVVVGIEDLALSFLVTVDIIDIIDKVGDLPPLVLEDQVYFIAVHQGWLEGKNVGTFFKSFFFFERGCVVIIGRECTIRWEVKDEQEGVLGNVRAVST